MWPTSRPNLLIKSNLGNFPGSIPRNVEGKTPKDHEGLGESGLESVGLSRRNTWSL